MPQLYRNNAFGTLASSIGSGATSIVLGTGQGSRFPAPSGGDFALATLIGLDSNGNELSWEIVRITARTSDTLTVVRAQESTTALSWPAATRIEMRHTAGTMDSYLPLAGGTMSGDLAFSGTGRRITGDFSNATLANRVMIQSSTMNGNTAVTVVPNGTATTGTFRAYNNSDPTNASFIQISAQGTVMRVESGISGTGTYRDLSFLAGASGQAVLDTNGNWGLGGSPSAWSIKALQVNNSSIANDANDSYIQSNAFFDGAWKYINTAEAAQYYQVNGSHVWRTAASGTAGNAVTFHKGLELTINGFLGNYATSGNGANFSIYSNGQTTLPVTLAQGYGTATDNVAYLFNRANEGFHFGTNNTSWMFLSKTGDLGLGTASPGSKLDVAGGIRATTFATNTFAINANPLTGSSTSAQQLRFQTTGADFYFGVESSTAGSFFPGSTAYAGVLFNAASTPMQFYTAGTLRATLEASGNFALGMGSTAAAYRLHMTDTLGFRANSVNIVGMKGSGFGYGPSGYQALVIGATGTTNQSTCIGYDPSGNPSGNFSGDGSEIVLRNFAQFIQPTAANTNFHRGVISLRSGSVGIQCDPNAWSGCGVVQIGDSLSSGLGFIASEAAGNTVTDIGHGAYWDGSNWKYTATSVGATRYRMEGANGGGAHAWFTAAGGTAGNNISFGDPKMVLDASGNFGVGTTAPKLRVQWSAATAQNSPSLGSAQGIAYFTNNDANYGLCVGNSSATGAAWFQAQRTDGAATAYDILLNPAGGNVGIGTTTPGDTNSFGRALDIRSSTGAAAYFRDSDDATKYALAGFFGSDSMAYYGSWGTGTGVLFYASGAVAGRFTSAGDFGAGPATPTYRGHFTVTSGANRDILLAGVNTVSNGLTVQWNHSTSKIHVRIVDIPTSSAGLPAGTLWNDAGTLKIA